ncbi:MAG: hypothetical protein ACP5QG_01080 [candidate division WOR-3 bacterium]
MSLVFLFLSCVNLLLPHVPVRDTAMENGMRVLVVEDTAAGITAIQM